MFDTFGRAFDFYNRQKMKPPRREHCLTRSPLFLNSNRFQGIQVILKDTGCDCHLSPCCQKSKTKFPTFHDDL
ncbi:hypothetical protein Mapa_009610 [Marchantia paleacea]|nr:hypothetical protein Mapa_009610 [Marchantia paleacea]